MGLFTVIPVYCGSEDFDALEEVWRERVESARGRYLEALSQAAEAGESRRAPEALAYYRRVLRYFTDLVMNRKIPPEDL